MTRQADRGSLGPMVYRFAQNRRLFDHSQRPPMTTWQTFALALLGVLLLRVAVVIHSGVWPSPAWTLTSDLIGALLLALAVSLRLPLVLRGIIIVLIGAAYLAAARHLLVHGTLYRLANIGYLSDPVFRAGTMLDTGLALLALYLVLGALPFVAHARISGAPAASLARNLIAMIVVVALYGAAVPSLTIPANNVIVSSLAQMPGALVSGLRASPAPAGSPGTVADIDDVRIEAAYFHREAIGHQGSERPNVLLILVEGLSAGYLPEIAAYHELEPVVVLDGFGEALEARGFRVYRNAVAMQRQTHRGSFVLFCGGYPRLSAGAPKVTDVVDGAARPQCLPQQLADHGWRTGYLQAAPLTFMDKDRFLPLIGFGTVLGTEHFGSPEAYPGWGPGDDVFFPGAARWILELDASDGPWFATLLNVGTHHPFPVADHEMPERTADTGTIAATLAPAERQLDRRLSFEIMARELIDALDRLEAEGALDDTVVLITSDEAGGFLRGQREAEILDNNFGFLALRPPPGITLGQLVEEDRLVTGLDVAITLLDTAGVPPAHNMIGRSLLARGGRNRGILLADLYSGRTMFLRESGELLACDEALIHCNTWQFEPGRLFGSLEPLPQPPSLDYATRRQLVTRAERVDHDLEPQ